MSLLIAYFVARGPGSFILLSGGVIFFLLSKRDILRRPLVRPAIGILVFSCLIVSALAWFISPAEMGYAVSLLPILALWLLQAGSGEETRKHIESGLFWGFTAVFVIAFSEVLFGWSLAEIRYPGGDNTLVMQGNRFLVSGPFPNYNDLAYSGAIYSSLLFGRLFSSEKTLERIVIAMMLFLVLLLCASFGSRAFYMAAIVLGLLLSWRTRYKLAFSNFLIVVFGAVVGTFAFSGLPSPVELRILDNSALVRAQIHAEYFKAILESPLNLFLGFGSLAYFVDVARAGCAECLRDPHNLVLETAIAYGLPLTMIWTGLVLRILWRIWRQQFSDRDFGVALAISILPVAGLGPSASLHYLHLWLLLLALAPQIKPSEKLRKTDKLQSPISM